MRIKELFNHPFVNIDKQVRFSNIKVISPENVAEHSEIVAAIGLLLSLELNKLGLNIDIKDVIYRSALHDLGEAVTCDITSDIKYSVPELPAILAGIEEKGLSKLNLPEEIVKDICNAKEQKDIIESRIVELADKFSAFFKIIKEYMIQRTYYYRSSLINNIDGIEISLNKFKSDYPKSKNLIDQFITELDNFNSLINSKVDFL